MYILLTNDDGFDSLGIGALQQALNNAGHKAVIVAPMHEKSATSYSLTVFNPLHVKQKATDIFAVDGFPSDCVNLGLYELLLQKPDLVISGINSGPNMGEDLLYSGTVGGAVEAMRQGVKSMAVSVADYVDQDFTTAAQWVVKLINNGLTKLIEPDEVFNINIPNAAKTPILGVKTTVPGSRVYHNFTRPDSDPRGRKFYWIGGQLPEWDMSAGSDCEALAQGYVSVTPIYPNFIKQTAMPKLKSWSEKLK